MPFIKSGYRGEMFVAISRLLYIAAEAFIVECVSDKREHKRWIIGLIWKRIDRSSAAWSIRKLDKKNVELELTK